MAANVIWNETKTYSPITASLKVAAVDDASVCVRNRLPQAKNALPSGPKAVEYPHMIQTSMARLAAAPVCVIIDSMFFERVSPP